MLADARAKTERLQVEAAEPEADAAALRRLALWATRYTPSVSPFGQSEGEDGFFLDIAGAAHLFGGEEALLADLARRLRQFGIPASLAAAGTAGAAWALSHYHGGRRPLALAAGREAEALAPLPVEALRLAPATCTTLRRLGFKQVGALIDTPRAPFAARFEADLLRRLDQALGRQAEPLPLIAPPPVYHSQRYLLEPVFAQEAIVAVATRLMQNLVPVLTRDGVAARSLELQLYRVDGIVETVDLGLTLPTRDVAHVARLLDLKLERMAGTIDRGFGFEALGLAVTVAERFDQRQAELAGPESRADAAERTAILVDSLRQRLGPASVERIEPVASHIPERSEAVRPAVGEPSAWPAPDEGRPRPALMLAEPEMAEVTALVPEGPPRRFRWRGLMHGVAGAQGPERIAAEWWRQPSGPEPTRDYYLVEDEAGRRYWLFREGLYDRETASPRWFVHGLFA